jgi:hypothetical protein
MPSFAFLMTHHTTPTLLEVLSYLTDPTFTVVIVLTIGTFAALQFINRIGGAK